ncbi:hypothetical protein OGAPHI_003348 [Ogataea philodendri]|uniref:Succinate dehydrogenase assembly factor 4, mitochondrial n=1 Tax=Ogataea philodendri TaxID=1378263 RepID=A0A9P8P7B9_9ASCO|nr:uncharacterized protein OGAPHI_003348 [Ogataea philodendri]KAH3666898.1 hypothetical protein OGAPHI_003348 [Ogataea philodendri]
MITRAADKADTRFGNEITPSPTTSRLSFDIRPPHLLSTPRTTSSLLFHSTGKIFLFPLFTMIVPRFRLLRPVVAARRAALVQKCASSSSAFKATPGPPKLDKEDQDEFEKLIFKANTQSAIDEYNEKLGFKSESAPTVDKATFTADKFTIIPEFEGNVNPNTGEVNGPKQDPLKHGVDWSFNGRVTDF